MKEAYKLQLNHNEVLKIGRYAPREHKPIFLPSFSSETKTQQKMSSFIESIIDKIQNTQEIDMTEIAQSFFPTNNGFKVFISHARADKQLAKGLSKFLSDEYQVTSFIDSEAWEHIDILKKRLSKKVEKSSDVEMLLTVSLLQMIDNCDYFIFLETNNSTRGSSEQDKLSTYSSWLFLELSATKFMRRQKDSISTEQYDSALSESKYYYTPETGLKNITLKQLQDLFSKK